MTVYNPHEIFEMAEQIERNGARFYRKAAENADGDVRGLFIKLAEMEDLHERSFASMKRHLPDGPGREELDQPEAEAFLQALAEGKIFRAQLDPSRRLAGTETPQQVLQTAITLEKDSVIFYLAMQPLVTGSRAFKDIERIIWEEMGHVTTLSNLLTALTPEEA